jgi:glycosyltransferase involved in cell wall biosynthesis
MKLSLCIATYNEEKNLHYPLDSAYDFVDEVVIVDGGSTDRTVEIAKSYGKKVRIINSDNPVMFHKNKQKAIEAARGEWILQLDADEEITKELKEEINLIINLKSEGRNSKQIQNLNDKNSKRLRKLKFENSDLFQDSNFDIRNFPVAYNIPRKNWFLTGFLMKGGQYPDYTIRLYKNGVARFPCRDVHENVEIINPNNQAPRNKQIKNINNQNSEQFGNLVIGYLKNPILHYADPDFSRYLMRWDRYTTAEVERIPKETKLNFFSYIIWKPFSTFFLMYFRHKGFMDGFPGFVFALFSSIRFWVIYIKWRVKNNFL